MFLIKDTHASRNSGVIGSAPALPARHLTLGRDKNMWPRLMPVNNIWPFNGVCRVFIWLGYLGHRWRQEAKPSPPPSDCQRPYHLTLSFVPFSRKKKRGEKTLSGSQESAVQSDRFPTSGEKTTAVEFLFMDSSTNEDVVEMCQEGLEGEMLSSGSGVRFTS